MNKNVSMKKRFVVPPFKATILRNGLKVKILETPILTKTNTADTFKKCPCFMKLRYLSVKTLKISVRPNSSSINNTTTEMNNKKDMKETIFVIMLLLIPAPNAKLEQRRLKVAHLLITNRMNLYLLIAKTARN